MVKVVGIRFKQAGKIYFFDPCGFDIKLNDNVIVETSRGIEYGKAVLEPKEVEPSDLVSSLKPVIRIAEDMDDYIHNENKKKAKDAMEICKIKILEHGLDMKLVDCEYTFDNQKVIFYFVSENRIDFRELVKDLAYIFKNRIELRQIGTRDHTKIIGGLGACGQPCCCKRFLSEFLPVTIKMARDQSLSLNQSKISGICGRLMCCLKFEEKVYEEKLKKIPPSGTYVITNEGKGIVVDSYTLSEIVKVKLTDENGSEKIKPFFVDNIAITKERDMSYAKKDEDVQFEYIDQLLD